MELTEKQEFDEVLLRLTQLGFAAVKAEAEAYITPEAIKSSKDELTAADIAIEFWMEPKSDYFSFELISTYGEMDTSMENGGVFPYFIRNANVKFSKCLMDLFATHYDKSVLDIISDDLLVECTFQPLDVLGPRGDGAPIALVSIKLLGFRAFQLRKSYTDLCEVLRPAMILVQDFLENSSSSIGAYPEDPMHEEARFLMQYAVEFGEPKFKNQLLLYMVTGDVGKFRASVESVRNTLAG